MSRNLTLKIVLIVVLVAVAAWTLYPPDKTLMPGIDLAGGTSLIYQIDTHGLKESDKRDLAQRMITVLRRRIDPANIQNLMWLPQGNSRFEIKMPLASAEARQERINYEQAEEKLLSKNVRAATVIRSLQKPSEERVRDFADFAQGDPNRLTILEDLAKAYDERNDLQNQKADLDSKLKASEDKMSSAGLDLAQVKLNVSEWANLDQQQLQDSLGKFTDANDSIELLTTYVQTSVERAKALNQLPEKDTQYKDARKGIEKLNLTKDQLDVCLEKPAQSSERRNLIEKLKTDFPDRLAEIDVVVAAFDDYRPFKGRLDDPKDLQRMLKGAGILEFRILPTPEHPEVDVDELETQVELLQTKGPKFAAEASSGKYVWCEIENNDAKNVPISVKAMFGDKWYVLASNNKPDEAMLHSAAKREWKLVRAYPTNDEMGRRAIGFLLDDRGGRSFANITGNNKDRPLCILLDGIAISAPNIKTRIYKQGIITGGEGGFTRTEVEDMVNKLNAGSLPARLIEQPISVNSIGPSIGADNRDQGIKAGLIGLAVVMVCMLVYYMLAGSIADVALLMNVLFVLAIMAGVRSTFTLPGIAGIILTIGMSVDANVLVFERIREEQQKGASLRIAIANGYQRAFRTIFDANLTTFITAAILYWRASEEVKGFAIVLMLGIASSMFTALFVTRVIFDFLLSLRTYKWSMSKDWLRIWTILFGLLGLAILVPLSALARRFVKDRLVMLRLIGKPNVNWMASRRIFFGISAILIAAGLSVFVIRDVNDNKDYDIEFTGGTAAVINLKDGVYLSRQDVEDRIRNIGNDPDDPNPELAAANVYSVGEPIRQNPDGVGVYKQYEINTRETNRINVTVTQPAQGRQTTDQLTTAITKAQGQFSGRLNDLVVTPADANNPAQVTISTSQMNQSLVKDVLTTAFPDANVAEPQVDEVVNNAILAAFADQLEIQQNLQPTIKSEEKISEGLIDSYPELGDYLGGIKVECELGRAAAAGEIIRRFKDLLFKPDMRNLEQYPYTILDSSLNAIAAADPNQPVKSFLYVSAEPEAGFRELSDEEWTRFLENERTKVLAAAELETSLPRVRQFDPSVGAEQKTRAMIAIVLSLFAIVTYIWIRFGNVRYGIAAIAALVHDVCITLGAITACTYLAGTAIGEALLIGDFKINLAMIAAFLTLIGYSLNDTIVVFDRIRENRGKARLLNPQVITDSINQTISRTILTSFTTFIVVLIMYIFGGPRLRGFTFAIGLGVIVGTYSSIAIAAPILLLGAKAKKKEKGKGK
jgi:SecD/SecF fusion protein